MNVDLTGHTILITGAARRIGRVLTLAVARAGADVIIHHSQSPAEAASLQGEVVKLGRKAAVIQADFASLEQVQALFTQAQQIAPVTALVNNAAIFESLDWQTTDLPAWQRHLNINLTAPFLLCQAFARALPDDAAGRVVNILDWRALRPGADHLPYTISKVGLAGLTRSLAQAFAPRITVNALALGAILPAADGSSSGPLLGRVPMGRWAELDEVNAALLFLLGPASYTTGEIIHLDGGRHLV